MQSLLNLRIPPHILHRRGTGVERMHGVIGIFPPPLDFSGMCALGALRFTPKRKRLFPIRRRVHGDLSPLYAVSIAIPNAVADCISIPYSIPDSVRVGMRIRGGGAHRPTHA